MRIAAAIGNANFVEAGSLIKIAIYSGLGSGVVAALFIIPLAYIPPIFSFFIPYSTSNSVPVRGECKGACDHVGVFSTAHAAPSLLLPGWMPSNSGHQLARICASLLDTVRAYIAIRVCVQVFIGFVASGARLLKNHHSSPCGETQRFFWAHKASRLGSLPGLSALAWASC